jgi:hypothetical protein
MYVTPKMVDRWKEIHWLHVDARCWKATYGPNTRGWAHLHESKDADREPWPEWTGRQPHDHPSNSAREKARKDLWWDLAIPDYTDLVDAMVGERIGIAAEMVMAHLSINIRMCPEHVPRVAEEGAMGGREEIHASRHSPGQGLLQENGGPGTRDQVEMIR